MVFDYIVSKPASLKNYPLHRMVAGLVGDNHVLFADLGSSLLVRTPAHLEAAREGVKKVPEGQMVAFELRACVSKKRKGRHIYPRADDWRSRHEWLNQKALENGFEVVTVHSSSTMAEMTDDKRSFKVDQTDFTGILKVTNMTLFNNAMSKGVGSTAKAFGFGLLII
ncbi:type I-E CRISPR-associated protein Cas6/Cse3/CasE [Porticoccaceae bacterium]|nr:type I-E CRISPR-associated protein Cas6/Cse3/CasE [Porticoccaceae bacterium]